MKKILFVSGVLLFGKCFSQHNDIFDFQKYLTNKNKAQKNQIVNPSRNLVRPGCGTYTKDSITLRNGNKVYALPQDKMPCIVPDISYYNMPVLKPELPNTMPNATIPPPDIQKLLKDLKEKYNNKVELYPKK